MPANPLGVALRNRRVGQHTLVWARPDLQAPENFTLTSPAFDHGAPIREKHRGRLFGANISPALNWTPPSRVCIQAIRGQPSGWVGAGSRVLDAVVICHGA
jgi:hypothetical protein